MKKRFCTTGTCIPEKNYMVDISGRIDRIISEYIENGQYFTINRARQYGRYDSNCLKKIKGELYCIESEL